MCPDNSRFWKEIDPSTQNYCLQKDIKKREAEIKKNAELREEYLQHVFDAENWTRLSEMTPDQMSWQDVELYNEIKKRYNGIGKDFSGNPLGDDFPQSEGSVPDITPIRSKIVDTCNGLIPKLPAGYSVQPLQEGATLQDILGFVISYRDALKNGQHPETGSPEQPLVDDDDIQLSDKVQKSAPKYTLDELKFTRRELERMIAELEE
ncbi:Uncharacterised protein [uncultured archaeon]|nr:Uncharacterised protein [uncultured archaeon]